MNTSANTSWAPSEPVNEYLLLQGRDVVVIKTLGSPMWRVAARDIVVQQQHTTKFLVVRGNKAISEYPDHPAHQGSYTNIFRYAFSYVDVSCNASFLFSLNRPPPHKITLWRVSRQEIVSLFLSFFPPTTSETRSCFPELRIIFNQISKSRAQDMIAI